MEGGGGGREGGRAGGREGGKRKGREGVRERDARGGKVRASVKLDAEGIGTEKDWALQIQEHLLLKHACFVHRDICIVQVCLALLLLCLLCWRAKCKCRYLNVGTYVCCARHGHDVRIMVYQMHVWCLTPQERFIVRDGRKHPGRFFQADTLHQVTFPYYNLPGFTDNVKV